MKILEDMASVIERHGIPSPKRGPDANGYVDFDLERVLIALEYLSDLASAGSTLAKQLPCNGDREVEDAIRNYIVEVKRITESIGASQGLSKLQGVLSCPAVERYEGMRSMLPGDRNDN